MAASTAGRIGRGIRIKGALKGGEDLVIEGRVEGSIGLERNHLTLERSAQISADLTVEEVTIKGDLKGNTSASERVDVKSDAKVTGDIRAPRIVMSEGAKFRGAIEMDVDLPADLLPAPAPAPAPERPAAASESAVDDWSVPEDTQPRIN